MTIPSSTIPAARRYIKEQTTSLLADPTVYVDYDQPTTSRPNDIILIGKTERQVEFNAMVGSGQQGWLKEEYWIDVTVSAYIGGDSFDAAWARMASLVDSLIYVVRNDPTLGGAVSVAAPAHFSMEGTWEPNHQGVLAEATGQIRCVAVL